MCWKTVGTTDNILRDIIEPGSLIHKGYKEILLVLRFPTKGN